MVREPGMRVASKVSSHCSGDHHVPKIELTRTPPTVVLPTSQWWDGTTLKDIYTDEFLRVGRFSRILALISNKNSFHTNTFQKLSKQIFQTLWRMSRTEIFQRNFLNPHWKANKQFWKHNEQVSKSPWITMDRKGANTFPFYNLPPEPRAISLRNFSVLLSFPFGENKRRCRLLLPRHFANQR